MSYHPAHVNVLTLLWFTADPSVILPFFFPRQNANSKKKKSLKINFTSNTIILFPPQWVGEAAGLTHYYLGINPNKVVSE